jgi:hypothetical protein
MELESVIFPGANCLNQARTFDGVIVSRPFGKLQLRRNSPHDNLDRDHTRDSQCAANSNQTTFTRIREKCLWSNLQ